MTDLQPVDRALILGLLSSRRAAWRRARRAPTPDRAGGAPPREPLRPLAAIEREVVDCRACPRLVAWREQVAREKRAAFADETYWGRPSRASAIPARARARPRPRARRARRQPHRPRLHGRPLGRLPLRRAAPRRLRQPADVAPRRATASRCATRGSPRRCAARRPANKPTPAERDTCLPFAARELALLTRRARRRLPRRVRLGRRAAPARRARHRSRARARASATAPRSQLPGAPRCSAASTRASRTRSPAG